MNQPLVSAPYAQPQVELRHQTPTEAPRSSETDVS